MSGDEAATNGNGTQTKILWGMLAALLGLGGIQGVGMVNEATPEQAVRPVEEKVDRIGADVREVRNTIGRTDSNGVPLIYMPRDMLDIQRQMVTELREVKEAIRAQGR